MNCESAGSESIIRAALRCEIDNLLLFQRTLLHLTSLSLNFRLRQLISLLEPKNRNYKSLIFL